jgi:hypothetical protein
MRRGRLQADEAALGSLENDEQSTVQSAGVAQTVADRSVPALAGPCLHNVTKRRCWVMQQLFFAQLGTELDTPVVEHRSVSKSLERMKEQRLQRQHTKLQDMLARLREKLKNTRRVA